MAENAAGNRTHYNGQDTNSVPEILFVAGEASGDMHASGVAEAIRAARPEIKMVGIGGPRMQKAGVELIESYEKLAVMGFTEVIKHIPKHYALLAELRRRIRSGSVSLVILIDYPGFNMKVADMATRYKVPVLYYVTPQVWAWGKGRLPKLARIVTRAATILPFEEPLLKGYGINATFVGHPLLDRAQNMPSREEARDALGIPHETKVLALFPGSREQEIERHLDDFVATAKELERMQPGLRVIVSAAPTVSIPKERCPYPLITSSSFTVLRAADVSLSKSGTTTLETAIADCPMAVAYRTGAISYMLAKRLVKIPNIGLVNIVAGRQIAREFVQDALEPRAVAAELNELIDNNSVAYKRVKQGMAEVREKLGTPGASERVARMALDLVC